MAGVRRLVVSCVLAALMLLAAVPAANAQRYCADAYSRCAEACRQQFGGGFLAGIMYPGCVEGCYIGYVWCASSN
jgi:hypothetical protein